MKISFDLDGTLIPMGNDQFATEKQGIFHKLMQVERMRLGTKAAFQQLKAQGHEVGIYTTSFRSKGHIRYWLRAYGLKADFIINEQVALPRLQLRNINASKYPPAFGIDLHFDDQPGLLLEAERYDFKAALLPAGPLDIQFIMSAVQAPVSADL